MKKGDPSRRPRAHNSHPNAFYVNSSCFATPTASCLCHYLHDDDVKRVTALRVLRGHMVCRAGCATGGIGELLPSCQVTIPSPWPTSTYPQAITIFPNTPNRASVHPPGPLPPLPPPMAESQQQRIERLSTEILDTTQRYARAREAVHEEEEMRDELSSERTSVEDELRIQEAQNIELRCEYSREGGGMTRRRVVWEAPVTL